MLRTVASFLCGSNSEVTQANMSDNGEAKSQQDDQDINENQKFKEDKVIIGNEDFGAVDVMMEYTEYFKYFEGKELPMLSFHCKLFQVSFKICREIFIEKLQQPLFALTELTEKENATCKTDLKNSRLIEDVSRVYRILLKHSSAELQEFDLSTVSQKVKDSLSDESDHDCLLSQLSYSQITDVVKICWKMQMLHKPMFLCQPKVCNEHWHDTHYNTWDDNSTDDLLYYRPVLMNSAGGSVACKGLVGNKRNYDNDAFPQSNEEEMSRFAVSLQNDCWYELGRHCQIEESVLITIEVLNVSADVKLTRVLGIISNEDKRKELLESFCERKVGVQKFVTDESNISAIMAYIMDSVNQVKKKIFTIQGDAPLYLKWEDFGLKIGVSQGSLPRNKSGVVAAICLTGGNFVLPENTALVSAVYAIATSDSLAKPLRLEVQHCVNLTRVAQAKYLKFVFAEFTEANASNSINFCQEEAGEFAVNSEYGFIELSKPCVIGIVVDLKKVEVDKDLDPVYDKRLLEEDEHISIKKENELLPFKYTALLCSHDDTMMLFVVKNLIAHHQHIESEYKVIEKKCFFLLKFCIHFDFIFPSKREMLFNGWIIQSQSSYFHDGHMDIDDLFGEEEGRRRRNYADNLVISSCQFMVSVSLHYYTFPTRDYTVTLVGMDEEVSLSIAGPHWNLPYIPCTLFENSSEMIENGHSHGTSDASLQDQDHTDHNIDEDCQELVQLVKSCPSLEVQEKFYDFLKFLRKKEN